MKRKLQQIHKKDTLSATCGEGDDALFCAFTTATMQHKSKPDQVLDTKNAHTELWIINGYTFGHVVCRPGWKWSEEMKPIVKTDLCKKNHTMLILRGRLAVKIGDKVGD
jgi:hypothetical protein